MGLIAPLTPAEATIVNWSTANVAEIEWLASMLGKLYDGATDTAEPSTVKVSIWQPVSGVMVKVWLEPALTSIVPEGSIAPFGPAEAVIAYWVWYVPVTVCGSVTVRGEVESTPVNKYCLLELTLKVA